MRQNKIFDVIQNMKKAASWDAAFWCIRILIVLFGFKLVLMPRQLLQQPSCQLLSFRERADILPQSFQA